MPERDFFSHCRGSVVGGEGSAGEDGAGERVVHSGNAA